MANSRQVKCPICGSNHAKEDMVQIGNRYYCKGKCQQEKIESVENDKWRKVIIEYLMHMFGLEEPNMVWLSQMKRYTESGMKMQGCFITLKYIYEKLGLHVRCVEEAMSLVPNYYSKAKEDYIQDIEIKKNTKHFLQQGKQPFIKRDKIIITKKDLEKQQVNIAIPIVKKIDLSAIDINEED